MTISKETREKHAAAARALWADPQWRAKTTARLRATWANQEYRAKRVVVRDLDWLMARVIPVPFSGCWIWTEGLASGYGRYGARTSMAHRLAYELVKGPIPDGLHIDHLCRVPSCVNPDHLEAVTRSVNSKRGLSPGIIRKAAKKASLLRAQKTHCAHGHEFSAGNTRITKDGRRSCRLCSLERGRKYKQRTRARFAAAGLTTRGTPRVRGASLDLDGAYDRDLRAAFADGAEAAL